MAVQQRRGRKVGNGWIWQQLTPQTVSSGRGWYLATIYTADGTRIASVAQEQIFTSRQQR